ncbi:MAG: cupin domain-containing protein, partial [Synechococcaceae bacterium WB4_1_0192]|nr:cupin domain-containing protein [Synechococcaceae bacterium WB4_1_0192]
HRFLTGSESGLTVVAWHPDSDTGPTDVDHPMVRRTMVGGVSAAELAGIQTR